jgi:DNA invertase Pin-like site-specific DNA recombinase
MRLVAYLRVSTAEQVEGYGLDDQEHAVRTWAKAHGHRIVAWRRDEGISGSNGPEHREGLADALKDVRRQRPRASSSR